MVADSLVICHCDSCLWNACLRWGEKYLSFLVCNGRSGAHYFLLHLGVSKGAIAGICVAAVVALCLVIYLYTRKYKRKETKPPVAQSTIAEHAVMQGGMPFVYFLLS